MFLNHSVEIKLAKFFEAHSLCMHMLIYNCDLWMVVLKSSDDT